MNRLTIEELHKLAEKENKALSGYKAMLMVCTGTGCVSAKGFDILEKVKTPWLKRDWIKTIWPWAPVVTGSAPQDPSSWYSPTEPFTGS